MTGHGGPRLRVAVVGGGANAEHEVSLASAAGVAAAVESAGHAAVRLTIGPDGAWTDQAGLQVGLPAALALLESCQVVFPVLHGPHGEDGTLAALCDLAGLPVVGSPSSAGAIAMDKWVTKLVAEAVGVATAPGQLVTGCDPAPDAEPPVVVKPVTGGSSFGVSLVRSRSELGPAVESARAHGDRVLVEQLVVGREIDLAVLGRPDGARVVAPALEVVIPERGLFDTVSKYDGSARFLVPAPVDPTELVALETAAVRVYDALGCAGVARVDFFLTAAGPVLNEVNTMPGFTEHSQVPRMFAAAGLSYIGLVDRLVQDACAGARRPAPALRAG